MYDCVLSILHLKNKLNWTGKIKSIKSCVTM